MKKIALAFAALALAAAPASASSGVQHYYIFYDKAEGDIVGYLTIYCDGTTNQNGPLTAFYYEEHYDC